MATNHPVEYPAAANHPTTLERGNNSGTGSDSHSFDEKLPLGNESLECITRSVNDLDVGFAIARGHANDVELDPKDSQRIRRKLDWHLLPLLCLVYTVQFIDKGSLGAAGILRIIEDNHLTADQFNTLSSAFYIGYLVFEYPQNWALQRFPVGKVLTANIGLWCLFLGLHPVAKNFGGLFILRFLLGASEGCMTAGLMLVASMFYTRTEMTERMGWTFQCNGLAVIISGFMGFGAFHADPKGHPSQWQWLYIACTIFTVITFVCFLLWFPDNPTSAKFLTEEEKLIAVKRVQVNQNGIETKKWKMYQFIEALTDIKTWLFFFFAGFATLLGGVGVQYGLIIKAFGFTTLQTTLLNIPSGASQMLGITLGCYMLRLFPNSRTWIGAGWVIVPMIACLVQITLPYHNKTGHLIALYLLYFGSSTSFIMMMGMVTSTVSGHTKRMTVNAVYLTGYALGQVVSSQFWKQKYRPRNLVPWGIILASFGTAGLFILAVRYLLVTENRRRDALRAEAVASGKGLGEFDDFAYLETTNADGKVVRVKVEKAMLDLTDKENLAFRYVL